MNTKELHSGLGSGALRELPTKWRKLADVNDTKGEHAFYVAATQRVCANELEAALSLSSPKEPPPSRVITEMREFAKECLRRIKATPRVDGNELHTKETYADILILCAIAEDVERARPTPQASSEVREAPLLNADDLEAALKDYDAGHVTRTIVLMRINQAIVNALAPSRQGAAKRVGG